MIEPITFMVLGQPRPKGSTTPFISPRDKKLKVRPANPDTKAWEYQVKLVASRVAPKKPWSCAIRLELEFFMPRPKYVKPSKRPYPTVEPDLDKLIRCVCDPLTKLFYEDDAQVIEIAARERYTDPTKMGVKITVKPILE